MRARFKTIGLLASVLLLGGCIIEPLEDEEDTLSVSSGVTATESTGQLPPVAEDDEESVSDPNRTGVSGKSGNPTGVGEQMAGAEGPGVIPRPQPDPWRAIRKTDDSTNPQ